MKQLQLVRVEVGELVQGMYIASLDRPWLGSPFLLEGFLLDDVADLEKLQALCGHVMVDITRSAATCQPDLLTRTAPRQKDPAAERPAAPRRVSASLVQAAAAPDGAAGRPSVTDELFTILRETVRSGGVTSATAGAGPTIQSDADAARARQATGLGTIPYAPTAPNAAAGPGNDRDWMHRSDAPGSAALDRRRLPRPATEGVGLDTDADSENLGGGVLIQAHERDLRPTAALLEAHHLQDSAFEVIGEFLEDARSSHALDIVKAQTVVSEMSESLQKNPDPLKMLSALKRKDDYSYAHAFDCSVHMMGFGQALGYGKETKEALGLAGLVIDLGKILLPEEILHHTGRLTPGQFKVAKEHVIHSIEILRSCPDVNTQLLEIVAQHHERFDGSGYPYQLKGKEVRPLAAIAGIVDTYTALTSDRAHMAALTSHTALITLQHHAGRLFNDALVEQFIQYIGIYSVGTTVELNTGEVGVVVNQNRVRRLKPTVMVLLDSDKAPMRYPRMVNLALDPPAFPDNTPYCIVAEVEPKKYRLDPSEFYLHEEAA